MSPTSSNTWLVGGLAIVLAAGGGYGLARLTATKPAAPAEAEPTSTQPGLVVADAAQLAMAGVKVEQVSAGGIAAEILAQATVHAAPEAEAVLTARAAGAVSRIAKRLGDPVRAGEVLALVESREAAAMAADRSAGAAKVALARQVLARELRLFEQKVSPRQDLETAQANLAAAEAEARRAQAAAGAAALSGDGRHVQVTSPIAGRIIAAPIALGAYVDPQTELFRVADPRRLQIEAAVGAADALRIKPGDAAVLETAAGATVVATVRAITPGLSEETRSATVVLDVGGEAAGLQPGQMARVRITPSGAAASASIAIPEAALQTVAGRDVVFVRTEEGFRAQPVVVTQRSGGRVEVGAGLTAGQSIATHNAFLLKAELNKGGDEEDDH